MIRSTLIAALLVTTSIAGASAQSYHIPATYAVMDTLTQGRCPLPQIDKRWLYYGRASLKSNLEAITNNTQKHYVANKLAEFDSACGKR